MGFPPKDREEYQELLSYPATTEFCFANRLVCKGHQSLNEAHSHAWYLLRTWSTVHEVYIRGPRREGLPLIVTVKRKRKPLP